MKFIKRNVIGDKKAIGEGVVYTENEEVILDTSKAVLVPKGTTDQRPSIPYNGYLRYNTDVNEFEVYQNFQWKFIGFKEPTPNGIVQQNLGLGDDVETVFGPLNSGDPLFPVPETPQAIIVLVENVFQIATTNYTLVQNPPGKALGWYLEFGTPVPTGKPVTVLHNFDK